MSRLPSQLENYKLFPHYVNIYCKKPNSWMKCNSSMKIKRWIYTSEIEFVMWATKIIQSSPSVFFFFFNIWSPADSVPPSKTNTTDLIFSSGVYELILRSFYQDIIFFKTLKGSYTILTEDLNSTVHLEICGGGGTTATKNPNELEFVDNTVGR